MGKQSWYVAISIILFHILAHWAGHEDVFDTKAPLGVASIATGVMVFMWLLSWGGWPGSGQMSREARIRAAIAGGIVAQYLSIVAAVAFFPRGEGSMQEITEAFVTSFTAVVTVVVAFYFSSSAYVESKRDKSDKNNDNDA